MLRRHIVGTSYYRVASHRQHVGLLEVDRDAFRGTPQRATGRGRGGVFFRSQSAVAMTKGPESASQHQSHAARQRQERRTEVDDSDARQSVSADRCRIERAFSALLDTHVLKHASKATRTHALRHAPSITDTHVQTRTQQARPVAEEEGAASRRREEGTAWHTSSPRSCADFPPSSSLGFFGFFFSLVSYVVQKWRPLCQEGATTPPLFLLLASFPGRHFCMLPSGGNVPVITA